MNRKEIESIENRLNTPDAPEDQTLIEELKKVVTLMNKLTWALAEKGYTVNYSPQLNLHGSPEFEVRVSKDM